MRRSARLDAVSEEQERAYCPRCETQRVVVETVPWQSNMCKECGAPIGGGADG